jgi:hypothetical protein
MRTTPARYPAASLTIAIALLTSVATASEAANPAVDALDEVVITQEHERQRRTSLPQFVRNPDVVTLSRRDSVTAKVELHEPRHEILFHRESESRRLLGGNSTNLQLQRDRITGNWDRTFLRTTVELAADISEEDDRRAVFRFGPHTSLVDIDYVRLGSPGNATLYYAQNAIHPETWRCVSELGIGIGAAGSSTHFLLLADTFKDCQKILQEREIDLLFADDFPAALRQALMGVYEPVYSRLSHRLGSEPGQIFAVWRPESQRNDFTFDRGWVRGGLLQFNGAALKQGLDSRQLDSLSRLLVREQIERRLLKPGPSSVFMQSAVNYLTLLTTSEMQHTTLRELSERLPEWIVECARHQGTQPDDPSTPRAMTLQCVNIVQFVYDAEARARSNGKNTIYDIWRQLLSVSFERGETGADAVAFAGSSADALRVVRGLTDGSVDWQAFATELDKLGVRVRIIQDQSGITAQVLSLEHFRDLEGFVVSEVVRGASAPVQEYDEASAKSEPLDELDEVLIDGQKPSRKPSEFISWMRRLVGQFSFSGNVDINGNGDPQDLLQVDGRSECIGYGGVRAVQCNIRVTWPERKGPNGEEIPGGVSALNPATILYGVDGNDLYVRFMIVDSKGIAEPGFGFLVGDTVTSRAPCVNTPGTCEKITRITAEPDGTRIEMNVDIERDYKRTTSYRFVLTRIGTVGREAP